MAAHAHLLTDLRCPYCEAIVTDLVWFQWGYCPSYGVNYEYLYRIGDAIRWMTADDDSTPAWTYFDRRGGNIGDPAFADVIARDTTEFYWTTQAERRTCRSCQRPLDGAAIEIRGGVIVGSWIYRDSELDNDVDFYVVEPDGRRTPKPEWNNRPMPLIGGGRAPPPNSMTEAERRRIWQQFARLA